MSIANDRRAAPGKMIRRSDYPWQIKITGPAPPFTHEKEPIILILDIINETAYIKTTFKAGFV